MSPSLVRTARATLVTVALALASVAVVSPVPANGIGPCGNTPVVINGVATGTVTDGVGGDWWWDDTTGVNLSKRATIAAMGGGARLSVWTDGAECTQIYCEALTEPNGTATCPVPDEPSYILVGASECCEDFSYVLAVTGGVPPMQDRLPMLEDLPQPAECNPAAICVGLFPGDVVASFPVVVPGVGGGATHHIAGYVDVYRFVVPGGGTVTLPCPVLTVDTTINPCQQAGGTYVSRLATLANQDVSEPVIGGGGDPLTTIRICEATLVATVLGLGVESFPAFSVC